MHAHIRSFFTASFIAAADPAFAQLYPAPAFSPGTTENSELRPTRVFPADIDGDRRTDCAYTSYDTRSIGALFGNGAGCLATPATLVLPGNPSELALADLDGDGDLDVAVAQTSPSGLVLLRNDGGRAFAIHTTIPLVDASGIALGDFDQDGDPDAAVTSSQTHEVTIVRNDGPFQLVPHATLPTGGFYPTSIAATDLDADGDLDLAVAQSASVGIALNTGALTFQNPTNYPAAIHPASLAFGDVDGDLRLDLVAAGSSFTSVVLLRGDGAGGFNATTYIDVGGSTPPYRAALADVDLDGHLDLVTASPFSVLRGDGQGAFAPFFASKLYAQDVVLADANDDGRRDAWLAGGTIALLLARNGGRFATPERVPSAGYLPYDALVLDDLSGDGRLDVALASRFRQRVIVRTGDGTGAFSPATDIDLGSGEGCAAIAAGDIDADGARDLATANRDSDRVSLLRGLGGASFAPPQSYVTGDEPSAVALGDLDGDGRGDVVVAHRFGATVAVLRGLADGTLQAPTTFSVGVMATSIALGDVDHDGDLDALVGAESFASIAVLLRGDGNGAFLAPQLLPVAPGPGSPPIDVVLADLDGDGHLDAASANDYGRRASILWGDGAGGFSESTMLDPFGDSPRKILAVDVEPDGDLDLVVGLGDCAVASILRNVGGRSFATATHFITTIAGGPGDLAAGDLDGDGRPELVAAGFDGELGVLRRRSNFDVCVCGFERYCSSGPSSTGSPARIDALGSPSIAASTLLLRATSVPALAIGQFFYGTTRADAPFGNGVRCVGGSVKRLPLLSASPLGIAEQDFDFTTGAALFLAPGATRHFQFFFRDPAGGGVAFDTSDAVSITFCP